MDETRGQINGLNLYMYCKDNPIMFVDPSGQIVTETIVLFTVVFYAILSVLTVTAVMATVYAESETHIIQNSLNLLENAIIVLGVYISTGINSLFRLSSINSNSINNTITDGSATSVSISLASIYNFENAYYYKRKTAAPRIKSNSKKKAREKAFLKGGKKAPIHHLNGKYGPQFHPNDPRFKHWHYYLWFLLLEDDEE